MFGEETATIRSHKMWSMDGNIDSGISSSVDTKKIRFPPAFPSTPNTVYIISRGCTCPSLLCM